MCRARVGSGYSAGLDRRRRRRRARGPGCIRVARKRPRSSRSRIRAGAAAGLRSHGGTAGRLASLLRCGAILLPGLPAGLALGAALRRSPAGFTLSEAALWRGHGGKHAGQERTCCEEQHASRESG